MQRKGSSSLKQLNIKYAVCFFAVSILSVCLYGSLVIHIDEDPFVCVLMSAPNACFLILPQVCHFRAARFVVFGVALIICPSFDLSPVVIGQTRSHIADACPRL